MLWFKKTGWVYLPITFLGWLLTLLAIILVGWAFVAIDRNSHSASDTLIALFPYASLIAIFWFWVANNTSVTPK